MCWSLQALLAVAICTGSQVQQQQHWAMSSDNKGMVWIILKSRLQWDYVVNDISFTAWLEDNGSGQYQTMVHGLSTAH